MPLSDVPNNVVNQTPGSSVEGPVVPAKRPLDDASQVEQPAVPAKRSKALDQPDQPSSSASRQTPTRSSHVPPPCDTYVQLRFQLHRFKGVYRVARVPLSFTFAHLYRYILFVFGWSGMHAHTFAVLSNVELYARTNRPGEIKKSRSYRIPEEPDREEDKDPVLRVTPSGRSHDDHWLGRGRALNEDEPFDRVLAKLRVPCKKDGEVTLGDIWSMDQKRNLSQGKCTYEKLAIKFEYDLSAPWEVDITIDPDKKGDYMWRGGAPRNYPELISAKGAPPLEDAPSYCNDIDGKKKTVSPLLFAHDAFERHLKGEIHSVVRNTEQAVYERGAPPPSVLEEDDEASDEEEEDDLQ